eukprot:TRINITY_DN293_c0_g1_i3.p1 TRINITY_DN293_c0_g1~~TRINITY_DN293_c0_g1_i3.p1  ORF type:complete len:300 (-),score=41.74 TRINITY_DN293_c0_g1_i3:73-972(-)
MPAAPFWTPCADPTTDEAEECPICFFYYNGGLNRAKCCSKAICTECFLKIKLPGKDASTCPFCNRNSWQVAFLGPKSKEEKEKEAQEEKQVTELMERMRLAEIEQDRLRDEQKRKSSAPSSTSSSVASSPAPRAPLPLQHPSPPHSPSYSPPSESGPGSRRNSGGPLFAPLSPPDTDPSPMTEEELEQAMLDEAIRISLLEDQSRGRASPMRHVPHSPPSIDAPYTESLLTTGSAIVGPTVSISNPFADFSDEADDFALLEAMRLSRELSSQPTNFSASSSEADEELLVRKARNSDAPL